MANTSERRQPSFRLKAIVTYRERRNGRDEDRERWIDLGALWVTEKRGLFTGEIQAIPPVWLRGGTWRVAIEEVAAEEDRSRGRR